MIEFSNNAAGVWPNKTVSLMPKPSVNLYFCHIHHCDNTGERSMRLSYFHTEFIDLSFKISQTNRKFVGMG